MVFLSDEHKAAIAKMNEYDEAVDRERRAALTQFEPEDRTVDCGWHIVNVTTERVWLGLPKRPKKAR